MKKVSLLDILKRSLNKIDSQILLYIVILISLFSIIFNIYFLNVNGEDIHSQISTEILDTQVNEPKIIELDIQDAQLLMKLAWSEAGNQGIEGQLAIMNVVMNRVNDENFPDTVKEVVYQKSGKSYQFSVVGNGVLKNAEPTEETHLALADLESGKDISQGALYFEAVTSKTKSWHRKSREFLFEDYGQRFYK